MGVLRRMDTGLCVLFSHLSLSIDASCQDDILEFNKLLSSFPRKGRTGGGEAGPLPSVKGGGSSNESFY